MAYSFQGRYMILPKIYNLSPEIAAINPAGRIKIVAGKKTTREHTMPQDIIDTDNILERLITLCESYNLKLPCELDSWHGFDSTNTKSLIKLGLYLETFGWRFIGMWPNPAGARNFHLRVARTGIYDTHALAAEIKMMRKLATDYTLLHYSDCTQQPIA